MPRCYSEKCKREGLPVAAMFPPIAKIAPAHVRPDGEPCTEVPGTYADDVREMIMAEDALWDLEGAAAPEPDEPPPAPLKFEPVPDRKVEAEPPPAVEKPAHEPATAREPKKPDRRADKRRRDDKRKEALAAQKKVKPRGEEDIDEWSP